MWTRRQSRECSLQMLYAFDNCSMSQENIIDSFKESLPKEQTYKEFTLSIFNGVCENIKKIDSLIEKYADNWSIARMATIDRNILRMSSYEILYMDTPISVIIDEAVEISKTYSNKDSSKFVNGILDKLKNERKK